MLPGKRVSDWQSGVSPLWTEAKVVKDREERENRKGILSFTYFLLF